MPRPARLESKDDKWKTPLDLAEDVRHLFGGSIGLDPCCSENNLRAEEFYLPEHDGLSRTWLDRTWCNPPYGRDIPKWLNKAAKESLNGHRIGLLLSVSRSEQDYFQEMITYSSAITLLKGKLRHSEGKDAMLASWIFWFNIEPIDIKLAMPRRGTLLAPWRPL